MKVIRKTFLIAFVLLLFNNNMYSQPRFWLKLTNPVYRVHRLIVDSQWNNLDQQIQDQNKDEKWIDHPVYWHNFTRYYEIQNKLDSAIFTAQKSCIKADLYFQNVKDAQKFIDRYYFDVKYLKLYYRKLLYDKLYGEISDTSLLKNKELAAYFNQQLTELNQTIPSATDININISLPHILFHLNSKNDSIIYKRATEINTIKNYQNYLLKYQQELPLKNLNEYPTHLASFFKNVEDTIYSLSWINCTEWDTELKYIEYANKYPFSPFKELALSRADQKGFQLAKELNTKESYDEYLSKYPSGAFRKVALKSLEFIRVIPIPFLNKYGFYRYIDSITQKRWIDSLFQFAYPFTLQNQLIWNANGATLINGCALVVNSDRYGNPEYYYIQKDGTPLNDNKFQSIQQISESLAFITQSGQHGLMDQYGRVVLPCKFERLLFDTRLEKGLFYNGGKWGIFGKTGNVINPPNIDHIKFLNLENRPNTDVIDFNIYPILVSRNNQLEFINLDGKIAINLPIQDAFPFNTNKTLIKFNDTWTVIDEFGNSLLSLTGEVEPVEKNIYSINNDINQFILSLTEDTAVMIDIPANTEVQVANYWGNRKILLRNSKSSRVFNVDGSLEFESKIELTIQYEIFIGKTSNRRKKKDTYYWYHPELKKLLEIDGKYKKTEIPSWIFLDENKFCFQLSDSLFYFNIVRDTVLTSKHNSTLSGIRRFSNRNYFKGINDSNLIGLVNQDLQWVIPPLYSDIVASGNPNLFFVETSNDSTSYWEVYDSQKQYTTNYKIDEIYPNEYPNYLLIGRDEKLIWMNSGLKLLGDFN